MKHVAFAFAACLAFLPAAKAIEAETAQFADSTAAKVKNLDNLVVTARRASASTPIAFTNISAEEIQNSNSGKDIPFLLSLTPSVVTSSDAGAGIGYTSLRIRGTDASRINVTTNGIPVNNSESHDVYWVNIPDLASSLQEIQIQRGVGTSTNGAGAFGASINMATDVPALLPHASLAASYGMYNTYKATAKAGTGLLKNHWAADLRLSTIGTDGYIDRASARLYGYWAQAGYYDDNSSLRLIAFGGKERTYMAWDYASKEQMQEFGRRYNPCGEYIDAQGNVAYYPNQYDYYTTHNLQLLAKHSFNNQWAFDAALHMTKGDGYYEQYKTSRTLVEYGLQPFAVIVPESPEPMEVDKQDLIRLKKMDNIFGGGVFNINYSNRRLSATLGGGANAYIGHHFGQVAWVRNYVGLLDPLQEYYRNRGHKIDANIYLRAQYEILTGFSAFADVQYRHIRYTIRGISDTYDWNTAQMQHLGIHENYNFLNPRLGLNYRIANHGRVYASWSLAHKEPTRDNFIDAAPNRPPLAERLSDFEAGYSYTGAAFSAAVGLYYMDYKNQLVATGQLSDTGNPVSENVDKSYRAGIELQGAWRPANWFEWNINATLSRNRIKNFVEYIYEDEWQNPITLNHGDTRISFSPDFILNNEFRFDFKGIDASIQSHYVSRQYLSNAEIREQSINPYFVTNLEIGYTFPVRSLKNLRLGLTVNNIFNAKYETTGYAGAGYYFDGSERVIYRYAGYAAQAPCNVLGSIQIEF